MNFLKQFLIGGVIGVIAVSIFLLIPFSELTFPLHIVSIILYIVVVLCWVFSFIIANKIKKIANKELVGEAEDEAEEVMNKLLYDFSFGTNIGAIIAMVAMSLSVMAMNFTLIIAGIVASFFSYYMTSYMMTLMKLAYPERELPEISDKDFSKKLLEASDDGERHIMLQGLYKVYSFANAAFLFAIMGLALYSVVTDDSQLFSIIVISIILVTMNGMYLISVRNR